MAPDSVFILDLSKSQLQDTRDSFIESKVSVFGAHSTFICTIDATTNPTQIISFTAGNQI